MAPKKSSKSNARVDASSEENATAQFERLLKQAPEATHYLLRLFITGSTPRSVAAIANIRSLCEQYLAGHFELEVVDIYQQPTEAQGEQIIAAPTLVREHPAPPRRMVGDLSNPHKVLLGLNLIPQGGFTDGSTKTRWVQV
jgi:circadian clock protein KaiB